MADQPVMDRGAAKTAAGASAQSMRTLRSAAIIGVIALACGAGLYFARGALAPTAKAPDARKQVRANVSYDPLPSLNTVGVPTPAAPPVVPAHVVVTPAPVEDQVLIAAQRAPLTAFSGSFPRTVEEGRSAQLQSRETEDRGGFERRFTPSRFDVAKAGHIGDRRFIVAQGTSIPCVLETAMQSDQPGFVSCVVPRDVLSDNGQVVLLDKGTQVVGEYRGGLTQGQSRLHVVWSRAKTPTGVVVELASAATDSLGRAGVGGTIDNHWAERFGSALLLSVVGDLSAMGTTALQQRAGVQAGGTGHAGQQAAAIAVEQTASIKPTLHKNQGEMVNIFVARDLDFKGVYSLTVVRDTGGWTEVPPATAEHGWPNSGPRVSTK